MWCIFHRHSSSMENLNFIFNNVCASNWSIKDATCMCRRCYDCNHNTNSDIVAELNALNTPDVLGVRDINIDLLKNTANSRKIKQFARNNSLTQLIGKPTRSTNRGSTLIDHVYTNTSFYKQYDVRKNLRLSDHCLILVTWKGWEIRI